MEREGNKLINKNVNFRKTTKPRMLEALRPGPQGPFGDSHANSLRVWRAEATVG
jgi:hypothetical protein